jgi:hypothetical protein
MRRTLRTLAWLYERALRLYPRAYRQEYGDEMRSVLRLSAGAAARRGRLSLVRFGLRELRDLPGAILHEHWRDARRNVEEATMTEWPDNGHVRDNPREPADAAPDVWTDRPCPWVETLAGLVPFLFIGLWAIALARLASPPPPWQLVAYVGPLVAGYVVTLAGLGVGWARGFPRWSYAYVLCVPLFSLYVALAAMSAMWSYPYLLCVPLFMALIPLAVLAIVVLASTRSQPSLAPLFTHVWRDWTRLSFAVYSLVPMLVWFALDEVEDRVAIRFTIALTLILAGGALAYLRSARAVQRALALLVGTVLARVVATAGTRIYWNTHPQPWMTGPPVRWTGIVWASSTGVVVLLAFVFAPALFGLLRRWMNVPRAA